MRLDHLLSRETRWLRDTTVPEVDIPQECENDGQPGKTGENGRRLPDSEIKSKRIKSESQKPFKELFTVSF